MKRKVESGRWKVSRQVLFYLLSTLYFPLPTFAQPSGLLGLPITEVRVEQEGRPVEDRVVLGLIETEVGEPLSMHDIRQTIDHLFGVGRFDDVQASADPSDGGVVVKYLLTPKHEVQALVFEGSLGLSESDLRQAIGDRFGALPAAGRLNDVAREVLALYEDRGFVRATVTPRVEEFHNPDRAVMILSINAGARARIQNVDVEGLDGPDRIGLLNEPELRIGAEYDAGAIQRRLAQHENDLRARGYYEARATHTPEFAPSGAAVVAVAVDRGPRVSIAFAGDPLPSNVRDELVPVRREGSADEDLLEDASRAIEDYLHARGYRDATAEHVREEKDGELVITFAVRRGPRHVLESVQVKGNSAVATSEIVQLLRVKTGEPFVAASLDAGIDAVRQIYQTRGFTRAKVGPEVATLPRPVGSSASTDRQVQVTLTIDEGPRTTVGSITIEGQNALTQSQIRDVMVTAPGRPYSVVEVTQDRDRVQLEYLNRGYESAVVDSHVTFAEGDTRADVRLTISEGPQVLVDRVIIVGNRRTSTETIERELLLKPGEPLGYSARLESQQRLAALGLFRRVNITPLRHGSEPRRDVLVEVEEAPPTTVGYGGGVELDSRLRTDETGQAEERIELAPRGFFEIGRRNLFGKNRSVNLFSRVALRSRDRRNVDDPPTTTDSSYGFNEYRVVGTFREPRVFSTRADLLVSGILDQAIRSSFNFRRRQGRVEAGLRLSPRYALAGRYSYEHTELFDEVFGRDEAPLIDRLFPQVRLSKLSGSMIRDTRSDPLDPDRGLFLSADNDFAARAMGSEVGFAKTFLIAYGFHRLPWERRTILALASRVGFAQGFPRTVVRQDEQGSPILGPDGQPLSDVVEDLPASERFFAGGETTVRGFSLDRLGTEETITPTGFPRGGNGLIVLNAELRISVWRALAAVGFVDAGNVFPRVGDMSLTDLRPAAGFGLRYGSPVGPIRIDLGFNLAPRDLVAGTPERRSVLHVSLGQAF